jgi:phosphatidylserine decarboxylase
MKHSGRAFQSALKLIFWALLGLIVVCVSGIAAKSLGLSLFADLVVLALLWVLFSLFTLYFFRDPAARVPQAAGLVVSPAHGKVDIIDELAEPVFMGGPCRRVSIFLSVFNVHVQNAPVSGKLVCYQYNTGQFLSALKTESAEHNENLLMGIEAAEVAGRKVGVRLIAGVLARRIVPFVKKGEEVVRGERISLIQFGSRTDLYLPLSAKLRVKLGDIVVGGETEMAVFD